MENSQLSLVSNSNMKIIVVGILLVISLVGHETNAKSVANTLVIEYKEKFEKHYY